MISFSLSSHWTASGLVNTFFQKPHTFFWLRGKVFVLFNPLAWLYVTISVLLCQHFFFIFLILLFSLTLFSWFYLRFLYCPLALIILSQRFRVVNNFFKKPIKNHLLFFTAWKSSVFCSVVSNPFPLEQLYLIIWYPKSQQLFFIFFMFSKKSPEYQQKQANFLNRF